MSAFEADEGLLRFTFDDRWRVLKWDTHPAHRKSMNAVDKSKAVDFIGIYGDQVFFIEVKDHRHYDRKNPDPLWHVVETKVRNTVAGLVGAHRRDEYRHECSAFLDAVCNKDLNLVLWLEAERPNEILDAKSKIRRGLNVTQCKPYIKWLDARVATCQLADYARIIPGLTVTTLPRPPEKK